VCPAVAEQGCELKGDMIWAILIGLVVGIIAKLLTPGRDPGGCIITALLGIAGGVLAGLLGHLVGWYRPGQPAGFIASVVGAIVILLIYRSLQKRQP